MTTSQVRDGSTEDQAQRAAHGRSRRKWMVTATAVLGALVIASIVAVLTTSASNTANPLVGQTFTPAPNFSLPELLYPNRTVTLADLRGHDTVLNFWQSSCIPCRTEMPLLQSADESSRGTVQFVGIDTTDPHTSAVAFLRTTHVRYLSLFDADGQVATEYGLYGTPTTVFITADGRVAGRHIGQMDKATLQAALAKAFHVNLS